MFGVTDMASVGSNLRCEFGFILVIPVGLIVLVGAVPFTAL
jgi:hypothetical protein